MEVSVRELKNRLSEYLRRVGTGEEFVVTLRGKPVGRLVRPLPAADSDSEAVARLNAQPWIRPGNGDKVRGSDNPTKVAPGTTGEIMRWVRGD